MDATTDRFVNFATDTIKQVNTIYQQTDERILVGTGIGLFLINPKTKELLWHGLKKQNVLEIFEYGGKVWLIGSHGWQELNLETDSPTVKAFVNPTDLGMAGNVFSAVESSSKKSI
ncbi:MAG: hypothetical protein ACI85I_002648 [Arenicella sp.]